MDTSTSLIKQYRSFSGNRSFLEVVALNKKVVKALQLKSSPAMSKIATELNKLYLYMAKYDLQTIEIEVNSNALNGIDDLASTEVQAPTGVMSSTALSQKKFKTWPFKGKWKEFIGEPAIGFAAIICGMPKNGKSHFAVQFANYLSANHGRTLYIASEEGYSATFNQKLKLHKAFNDNLFTSDAKGFEQIAKIIETGKYLFVFIDSINKAGLNNELMEKLKAKFPNTSFLYVIQSTKGGKFRGSQELEHNCDVVVEVVSGIATQRGRYQPEGQLNVFE